MRGPRQRSQLRVEGTGAAAGTCSRARRSRCRGRRRRSRRRPRRAAELILPQDLDGLHAAFLAGALIAHLGDELGPGGEAVADEAQFVELLHEGLLAVEVFVMLQRGEHHRGVVSSRGIDDDGVELVGALGEGFAVIAQRPGAGVFLGDLVELALLHVAEAGPLDHGVILQALALQGADAADADLEDAQFAVFIGLRTGRRREGGEAGGEDGAGAGGSCDG